MSRSDSGLQQRRLAILHADLSPTWQAEVRFHPTRRWRFDFADPETMMALEIEGGVWTGGRHTRGKGFLRDIEKYNTATSLGWRIFRTTPQHFGSKVLFDLILDLLEDER